MTTRSIAAACLVAAVAIVAIAIGVVLQDTPAHDVRVNTPSSQPGPAVPQPTGGAR
jgi:hypothetical protein